MLTALIEEEELESEMLKNEEIQDVILQQAAQADRVLRHYPNAHWAPNTIVTAVSPP